MNYFKNSSIFLKKHKNIIEIKENKSSNTIFVSIPNYNQTLEIKGKLYRGGSQDPHNFFYFILYVFVHI